ncbi:unnamed protein product [Brassicogethes aeneus]|uniref:Nuclear pore complex protein Nup205 n=1 Tax=Brassicogethes aeneus TaxID=1431903 RepID=A0A9P0AT87_BRAAE|nr:unnamed protein product [Brassicogethes aeneus]
MGEVLLTKSEDLWNPYKDLKGIVWKHLNEIGDDLPHLELENTLRKHKQSFFSLLENPAKNAKSREELKKGMVDGITVKGIGHQILSKELYQEAIILSDMFNINEFVALDLLCTAQIQMPYYPSLPRGLVAVLLYYDGRKALVSTLLYLVQARSGVQWSAKVKPDLERFITDYTDQLMEGGLFNRIFDLLKSLDLSREIDLLQQNLALGGPKHRRQVTDLFLDIRNTLADVVFSWSAQSGLPKDATVALVNHLRDAKIEQEASGKIDDVNLYLLMALLYALDLSILHTREDGEEAVQSLPILSDQNYISAVINEFTNKPRWANEGLESVSTFCLSVCLASLKVVPNNFVFQDAINREESFVDLAIEMNCFEFMYNNLLECDTLYKEPFLYKRMHNLMSDFIVYMYSKIKELRLKADEIARTMQLNYWSPIEINPASQSYSYRAPPRAVSLFKFVRLAGDMLPMSLFVPYLSMLSGLSSCQQTARHCFNMLKQVGSQLSQTLSWDHFFLSFAQYYTNLRQEAPPVADTVYRNRVTAAAFHKDEFSRLALCEHPGWSPLTVLLGLVSCSVPIPLKADLLLTLVALSKSSENAFQTWDNLESSQILMTVPTTSSYAPRGIQTELDEIESRMEEYPLTRALLKLLDCLTDFGIPRTLGAGPRQPGFDPYLSFIVNSVFLKFPSRSYRNNSEKWQVAQLCLKLFEKFLATYDPKISDFPANGATKEFSSPPGFHLMLQLNTKSELLNVILDIIDEGNRLFDTYVSFQGETLVKDCTLSSLNILHRVLMLQPKFFSLLASSSSSSIILTSIGKLLLTINRRSGKPDHCVNVAKYVSYQLYMPLHTQVAVKILAHITSSPVAHNQFVNILLSSEESKKTVKTGFVECLDSPGEDNTEVIFTTKIEILKLLKQCLSFNAPNFTHYLLGFDLKRDISKTEFQFPGVLDFPRSCLHSIISNLENYNSIRQNIAESHASTLLESAYHMLYLLAANGKTSGPVLRFVRLNKTFYKDHLRETHKNIDSGIHELNQFSWLMKMLAIELKVSGTTKQVTYLKQLAAFLVNIPSEQVTNQDMFSLLQKSDNKFITSSVEEMKMTNFMTDLIRRFEYKSTTIDEPSWEFFDASVLNKILISCQSKTSPIMIDLKKLHQILYEELKTLQGTAVMGQIQQITQEIPKVLKYALELNKRSEQSAAVVQFVNGWRQVIEVLVNYMPPEVLNSTEQQLVCIFMISNLLRAIVKSYLLPEVSRLLSGAILLMMDTLKSCYTREQKLKKFMSPEDIDNDANVLQLYTGTLRGILENLIEWIMVSDVVDGELRINLYATLVTFLQFTRTSEKVKQEDFSINCSMYVSRLDSSRLNVKDQDLCPQIDIFSTFGEKLIEILCHDCIGGQEICKMLAMSSFSHLLTLSGNINWILYMSGKGYLKHIIQSILDSDTDLRNMLEPNSDNIKPLYLYLAKILLLARLASTRAGAELLLEQRLFSCFSNMTVFSLHPEISKNWRGVNEALEDFLPPMEQQYLEIFLPTLDICNIILTSLGTENQSAVVQIMYYLLSHLDIIELILRSGHPDLSAMSLKELSLLTFVLSRTANNDLINVLENPNIVHNNRAQLYRIQKLMLGLLPKFILSEDTVKRLMTITDRSVLLQTSDRLLYAMQIMSNLLCYSRNIVANHGIEHSGVGVIFTPTLNDPLLTSNRLRNYSSTNQEQEQQSLGVIVQQLMSTVNYQHQEKVTYDMLVRKLSEIADMKSGDLRQFIDESMEMSDLSAKKEKAYEVISDRLEKKKKEMEYCSFIIENSLYLIWTHLDYYMLKAIPKPKTYGYLNSNANLTADSTLASASEATWKVSTDVISDLKQGLVSLFNDSFSKQLLETAQGQSESDVGLIEALLRKIKRLVQFVPVK